MNPNQLTTMEASRDFDDADAPQAPHAPAARRRRRLPVSGSNLMLAGMLVAGIGAVCVLRMNVGPEVASAEQKKTELQIDTAISLLDSPDWSDQKDAKAATVIDTLDYEVQKRQIAASLLTGNPFVFRAPGDESSDRAGASPSESDAPTRRLPAKDGPLARAKAAVQNLALQSVILSPSGSMAMISDSLLAKGQIISGWTIADIQEGYVVLTWRDQKEILRMSE